MAIITFMSDFGVADHYVAAIKAKILSLDEQATIVDISHQLTPFDLGKAAFVLGSVFRDFPKGTVHLSCISAVQNSQENIIATCIEDHFFVGWDNGIYSLISNQPILKTVKLQSPEAPLFLEKEVMAQVAVKIAKTKSLDKVGSTGYELKQMLNRQAKATKRQIHGQIIYVDTFGNLITNIKKVDFDAILALNTLGKYSIRVGKEKLQALNVYYSGVEAGDLFIFFNSLGLLEVGINKGNAHELLGLGFDSAIMIDFEQEV